MSHTKQQSADIYYQLNVTAVSWIRSHMQGHIQYAIQNYVTLPADRCWWSIVDGISDLVS